MNFATTDSKCYDADISESQISQVTPEASASVSSAPVISPRLATSSLCFADPPIPHARLQQSRFPISIHAPSQPSLPTDIVPFSSASENIPSFIESAPLLSFVNNLIPNSPLVDAEVALSTQTAAAATIVADETILSSSSSTVIPATPSARSITHPPPPPPPRATAPRAEEGTVMEDEDKSLDKPARAFRKRGRGTHLLVGVGATSLELTNFALCSCAAHVDSAASFNASASESESQPQSYESYFESGSESGVVVTSKRPIAAKVRDGPKAKRVKGTTFSINQLASGSLSISALLTTRCTIPENYNSQDRASSVKLDSIETRFIPSRNSISTIAIDRTSLGIWLIARR